MREAAPSWYLKESIKYPERKKSSKILAWVNNLSRTWLLGSALGGLGAGTAWRMAAEEVFERRYGPQYEQLQSLEEKEKKLKELFGQMYTPATEAHRIELEQERKRFKVSPRGPFTVPKEIIGRSWGPREHEHAARPQTTHIDTIEGPIDADTVQSVLQETFPTGWVNNEIQLIRQTLGTAEAEGVQSLTDARGKPLGVLAVKNGGFGDEKAEVVYYAPAKSESVFYIRSSIGHEIAHANDWKNDAEMTSHERADLALAVAERIASDDRFMSSYVETIADEDEKIQREAKANEYWAEIVAQYLEDPSKLHIKDFGLVDRHIRKTDPKFNWKDAKERRDHLIAQALKNTRHAD